MQSWYQAQPASLLNSICEVRYGFVADFCVRNDMRTDMRTDFDGVVGS